METILISGTNRGIGLELVRQYLTETPHRVYATVRTESAARALDDLVARYPDRLTVLVFDVSNVAQMQQQAAQLVQNGGALDVLINNAGMNPPGGIQRIDTITSDVMLNTFHVNTVGPLMLVQQFLPMLKRSQRPCVVNVSSGMGSLTERDYGGYYAYCTSKAALNMVTRGLAIDLAQYHGLAIALDPGWVKTDMGGSGAELEPYESVEGIRRIIDTLTHDDNGAYVRWNGERLPW